METRQSLQWGRKEDGVTTRSGRAGSHARELQKACSVRGDKGCLLEWKGLSPGARPPRLFQGQAARLSAQPEEQQS